MEQQQQHQISLVYKEEEGERESNGVDRFPAADPLPEEEEEEEETVDSAWRERASESSERASFFSSLSLVSLLLFLLSWFSLSLSISVCICMLSEMKHN